MPNCIPYYFSIHKYVCKSEIGKISMFICLQLFTFSGCDGDLLGKCTRDDYCI